MLLSPREGEKRIWHRGEFPPVGREKGALLDYRGEIHRG